MIKHEKIYNEDIMELNRKISDEENEDDITNNNKNINKVET